MPSPGDILTLRIEDIVYRGSGLARADGMVVFVPGTAYGELVRARVTSLRKRFCEAELLDVFEASPDRAPAPDCRLADGTRVPGCVYDHLLYPAEVEAKKRQLENFLRRFADGGTRFHAPFPSPRPLHYRNKTVFHAQKGDDGRMRIGYVREDDRAVLDIDTCPLARDEINDSWSRHRAGILRTIADGETVTLRYTEADGVASWVGTAPKDAPWLTQRTAIGDLTVAPDGFFQVNDDVAAELVAQVRTWLSETLADGADTVLDLYCGVGVFGLAGALAGAARVVGVESAHPAVTAARRNARSLDVVPKTRFTASSCADAAKDGFGGIDLQRAVVVVDPPRAGMERATAEAVVRGGPKTVVYVSCDPATLARDLAFFRDAGYAIRDARVLDMFPRTLHFETAIRLGRAGADV